METYYLAILINNFLLLTAQYKLSSMASIVIKIYRITHRKNTIHKGNRNTILRCIDVFYFTIHFTIIAQHFSIHTSRYIKMTQMKTYQCKFYNTKQAYNRCTSGILRHFYSLSCAWKYFLCMHLLYMSSLFNFVS